MHVIPAPKRLGVGHSLGWVGMTCFFVASALGPETATAQRRAGRRRAPAAAPTAEVDSPTEQARSLFGEGVALASRAQFAEAEERFRSALALRDAPAIRYNLASVLFEQGEYPEAQLENELALAADALPEQVQTVAEELRRHIAERAAFVRFELVGDAAGGTVRIDGFALAHPGLEIPITPTTPHTVTVTAGDEEVARREVEVPLGERRIVSLGQIRAAVEVPPPPPVARSIDQEEWFWPAVAGGGLFVVTVVAVSVGVAATSGTEGPIEGNFTPGVIRW